MAIEKYSRDYKNLNQTELQVILKHHDTNFTTTTHRTKDDIIRAIVKFIPNFNTSSNTQIYYFKLENGNISWFTDSSQIDPSQFPFKNNTHKNHFSDRIASLGTPEHNVTDERSSEQDLDQNFHNVNESQNMLVSNRENANFKPFGNIKFKVQFSDERGVESFLSPSSAIATQIRLGQTKIRL